MNKKSFFNGGINVTVALMIILASSKILGFAREMLMAYLYGANDLTDSLTMATSCAGIVFGWLATLSILHTPFYQKIKNDKQELDAQKFTNQLIILIMIIGGIGVLFLSLFAKQTVSFVAYGFSEQQVDLTVIFFRWMIFSVYFNALNQVWISELNCKSLFIKANITNLVLSIIQIFMISLSYEIDDFEFLKYSQFIATLVQFLILLFLVIKSKHSYKLGKIYYQEFTKLFELLIPIFIISIMDEINALVDKMFGSNLVKGSISALNYAHLIKQLFFFIFATAIITVVYPKLSAMQSKKDYQGFSRSIFESSKIMILIFTPITIFVVLFSNVIVTIVYKRGSFDEVAVKMTSQALAMYSSALLPLAIREVLVKGFQAMLNTKVTMIVGAISTFLNIVLNFLLVINLQYMGLALSTSLVAYVTLPLLFFAMKRELNEFKYIKQIWVFFLKILLAATVGMICVKLVYQLIIVFSVTQIWMLLSLGFSTLIGLLVYTLILIFLKVEETKVLRIILYERFINKS